MIGSASDRTVMRSAQETQRAAQAWGWSASRSRSDGHESVGFTRQSLLSPRASSPRSSPWPIALRNPFGSPKKRAMATSTASGHGNTVIETTNSSSNGRYDWCQTIAPSIGGWPRSSSQFSRFNMAASGCSRWTDLAAARFVEAVPFRSAG
jgi:hypothetical protein